MMVLYVGPNVCVCHVIMGITVIVNKNAHSQTKSSSKQLYYSQRSIFYQLYSRHYNQMQKIVRRSSSYSSDSSALSLVYIRNKCKKKQLVKTVCTNQRCVHSITNLNPRCYRQLIATDGRSELPSPVVWRKAFQKAKCFLKVIQGY